MKKKTLIVLILISIVALVFGTAASSMGGKRVNLAETRFIEGKGVVFIFEVEGLTKADLKNSFSSAGSVDCKFKDDGRVACTVQYANQYAGQQIPISLAGYGFYADVPAAYNCFGWANTWVDADGLFYTVYGPYGTYWTRDDEIAWSVYAYENFDDLVSNDTCVKTEMDYFAN